MPIALNYTEGVTKMGEYVGVDVGKSNLDICYSGKIVSIPNELSSINKWVQEIKKISIELIICEATGGYERPLVNELRKQNIPIFIEHANKIRSFAKSKGLLAKTDRIDAQLIREYASIMKPKPKYYHLSEEALEIRDLLKRRDQLIENKSREAVRLDKQYSPKIKQSIRGHITYLEQQIQSVQQEIEQATKQSSLQKDVDLLTSIPGIGRQTALMILTFLPEIGVLENKSLAALVGVAPFNRDSGQFRGKRFIQGGRKALRKALYMAAVASIRWNKPLKEFYHRLILRGKCAKVSLVAVINKMIAMVNSVYKRQSPWIENLAENT